MRLLSYRPLLILPVICSLCSCALFKTKPESHATGYLADRGVVRIWQHTSSAGFTTLDTIFTPFNGSNETETRYHWNQQQLVSISKKSLQGPEDSLDARFSRIDGTTTFMQRKSAVNRQPLTVNELELAKFEAQRIAEVSRDLISGRVALHQGRWLAAQQVESCEGALEQFSFENKDNAQLNRLSRQAPVYVAWLDAPEGQQVLLMTARNICQQRPDVEKK
ncbi:DUF1481 domain-containing protein [Tatumella sp. TA1]|uniref:DUF1481 domain-containing protein n=1 Tax=Rosenbergiella collisarenosi TaxID=1544695 RepID=UPI0008F8481D|nr:DUF1481 domain-containing protein [Rosenbergiella collisarenosi]MBT0722779.1 DUF1481 domain-containing protein [Rosenbergiella collisarenosi]QGX90263.1 DUF1481 domain-containing protein [Tatumella sp. TA1]